MKSSVEWINHLNLEKHPEGGYYREIYRNSNFIGSELANEYGGERNLATSIYFLLEWGSVSKLHRLKSDEIWYFHEGSSVDVHIFFAGQYTICRLGRDFENGEQLQVMIPSGAIFGAMVNQKSSYVLVGCMVTPGFHFDDFEMISFQQACVEYPLQEDILRKLT